MRCKSFLLFALVTAFAFTACDSGNKESDKTEKKSNYIRKYRDDGTLLSVTSVNKEKYAHGVKVNYYEDGKAVHSKVTYNNGRKDGPAIWYYKNGQVFEHTGFKENMRHGVTRKYYKSGKLMAEYTYDYDQVMPGLKEYTEEGDPITDYPDIRVREIDKLKSDNKLVLEISTSDNTRNTRFYQLVKINEMQSGRSYLDSKNGICQLEFYVHPGNVLIKTVEFYAEIPTSLGNFYIVKKQHDINVMNL